MTAITSLATPVVARAQNFYHAENNDSQFIIDAVSTLRDELPTIVNEAQKPLIEKLQILSNQLKDAIQQAQKKDEEIQALKKTTQEMTERLKPSSITETFHPPIKNNICYSPHSSRAGEVIMRTHGFGNNSTRGKHAKSYQVMVEFVPKFPKKFTLDIKGYFTKGWEAELPEDTYFKVHVGKDGKEIRHTKTFKLFKGSDRYEDSPDYTDVEFETENEDNNTIWIDVPKIPDLHIKDHTVFAGLDLHLLNIIPR